MNSTRKVVIIASVTAMTAAFLFVIHHSVPDSAQPPPIAPPATAAATAQTSAPMAATPKPMSRDAADDGGELVDICGVGKVRLDKDDPSGMEYVGNLATRAGERWIATLQSSSDPHARAAGLILAGPERSEAVAQLALQNADPVLYGLALEACGRTEHPGAACSQISPDSWAQLDPDNAAPWLQVAGRARLRGDSAGEAAAMKRAAAAMQIDDYYYSLYAYAQPSLPAGLDAAVIYYLSISAFGVAVSGAHPQYTEARKYCSDEAVHVGLVADECRALANLFESAGATARDLGMAKSIGARVGWSQQRIDAATKYLQALQAELETTEPGINGERWSCGALSASNAYLSDMARLGEIPALRERFERSGISVPERAQQHREFVEKLIRDANTR
jgi:hypothetical protein